MSISKKKTFYLPTSENEAKGMILDLPLEI